MQRVMHDHNLDNFMFSLRLLSVEKEILCQNIRKNKRTKNQYKEWKSRNLRWFKEAQLKNICGWTIKQNFVGIARLFMQNFRRLFQHLLRKYSTQSQPSPEKHQLRNQNRNAWIAVVHGSTLPFIFDTERRVFWAWPKLSRRQKDILYQPLMFSHTFQSSFNFNFKRSKKFSSFRMNSNVRNFINTH